MSDSEQMVLWMEFLATMQEISEISRGRIADACATYLTKAGYVKRDEEAMRATYRAALDGMADLIQYGELGGAAITRLHDARRQCGILLPEADERRRRSK